MNPMNYNTSLGNAIRFIRLSKNIKQEWVAAQVGYSDKSTYAKIEYGKLKQVAIDKVNQICEALECESYVVMKLAVMKNFNHQINSWEEFILSLEDCSDEELGKLISIIKEAFPQKYILYESVFERLLNKK